MHVDDSHADYLFPHDIIQGEIYVLSLCAALRESFLPRGKSR
jgi:hypothetical protein